MGRNRHRELRRGRGSFVALGHTELAAKLKRCMIGVALATVLLLLIPAVAMQFTSEVSWGPGDFLVAGTLLFGAGALIVLGLKHVSGTGGRAAARQRVPAGAPA